MENLKSNKKIFYKEDINKGNICPFELYGLKPKKVVYIPFKNQHGEVIDKCMKVTIDGEIYKKLILSNGGELPKYIIQYE